MARLLRSFLFVPGNNKKFIDKAKTLNVDIICLDLEDSVPMSDKDSARKMLRETLQSRSEFKSEVYVRTNSFESGIAQEDLKAVVQTGINGVVIPKVNDANEVFELSKLISDLERTQGIKQDTVEMMPSIESAKGVVNAYKIASASPRVSALVFGVFDFLFDMGLEYVEDGIEHSYARAKVPVDARAAGVYAIDSIWQKIDDTNGLIKDATAGMKLGYKGKSIIHPSQIEPVHKIFVPNKEEMEWARKVVDTLSDAMNKGKGAVRLEGKMIDAVHYKRAKALLDVIGEKTQ
ncbi:MAG: citrate lyase subunit beta/citryl-CoA lyase [Candidatus Nitrosomirales archaeon]|jgi:citrate lyase subunit beta/citryl-CoA lyase